MVEQGDERVERARLDTARRELEAVREEDPDNPVRELRTDAAHTAGDYGGHPLRRGSDPLVPPVPLLVVVHVLEQPLEHLPVLGPEQGESDRQDEVEHLPGAADPGEDGALRRGVVGLRAQGADEEPAAGAAPAVPVGAAHDTHAGGGGT